jgi:quercetin dioxygenase-like cupin family protein
MTTNRHCDEVSEIAALYALGKLPEAEALGFEQRIESGCSLCQAELDSHQRTAEMLLSATVGAAPPAALEERLMRSISMQTEMRSISMHAEMQAAPSTGAETFRPEVLRSGEGEWVAAPDPGVSYRFLHGKKTVLVRMEPGSRNRSHVHSSNESCLVLEGTVEDGDMKLNAGDFLFMPAGTTHTTSYSETGCLLLIAYA